MKKILSVLLVTTMILGLSACGSTANSTEDVATASDNASVEEIVEEETEEQETTEEVTEKVTEEVTEAVVESDTAEADSSTESKTLIVYYSATGTTEGVAEFIAEKTGGDLFELEPVDAYTDEDLDWTNQDSRVSVEHDNEDARNVELLETVVPDFDSYETVYIGYPIWWGIAAWPVDTFVKANDFTGKTVIPFATASSSGIGQSGELLEEMAGTGNWLDGEIFRRSATQEDINEWIDSL